MTLLEIITAACEDTGNRVALRGRWVEITTQQLDRHNDMIEVYAKLDDDTVGVLLTDYSELILDMTACGRYESASRHLLDSVSEYYHSMSKSRPIGHVYAGLGMDSNWADSALYFLTDSLEPESIRTGIAQLAQKLSEISNTYAP